MTLAMGALEEWMSSNRLRLNSAKTQFIWLGARQQLAKLNLAAITAAYPHLTFSSTVRDLGVTLDQQLTFFPHIHRLCRDSYYQLLQLRTIVRSLNTEATATLVHSFVVARLDYCCTLYAGLPAGRLACLNRVLRSAARLIGRIHKFGHVTSYMLHDLHWLPLHLRISYRIVSLVWRSLLGIAPSYLSALCCPTSAVSDRRSLRSTDQGLLLVPFARSAAKQRRAFSVVWNGLPAELRLFPRSLVDTFCTHLKTWVGSAPE